MPPKFLSPGQAALEVGPGKAGAGALGDFAGHIAMPDDIAVGNLIIILQSFGQKNQRLNFLTSGIGFTEIAYDDDSNSMFVHTRSIAMSPIHLFDPARASLNLAIHFPRGAVIN